MGVPITELWPAQGRQPRVPPPPPRPGIPPLRRSLPHPPPPGPCAPHPVVCAARRPAPRPVRLPPPPPGREQCGPMSRGPAGRLCKCPTACENPLSLKGAGGPARSEGRGWGRGGHCIGMSCRPERLVQSAIVCTVTSSPPPPGEASGRPGRQREALRVRKDAHLSPPHPLLSPRGP